MVSSSTVSQIFLESLPTNFLLSVTHLENRLCVLTSARLQDPKLRPIQMDIFCARALQMEAFRSSVPEGACMSMTLGRKVETEGWRGRANGREERKQVREGGRAGREAGKEAGREGWAEGGGWALGAGMRHRMVWCGMT